MSRFKNEVLRLDAHIKTLRIGASVLVVLALVMGVGWWSAPRDLTIHVPPDLRSGSTRKWWEVPPESVYAFTFYVFQQLNRWPSNGEEDYARNLHALSPYLPFCRPTTTPAATPANCVRGCAASTRFRGAATATTPAHGCGSCPSGTGW
mgnify:CR=1 FL=1